MIPDGTYDAFVVDADILHQERWGAATEPDAELSGLSKREALKAIERARHQST